MPMDPTPPTENEAGGPSPRSGGWVIWGGACGIILVSALALYAGTALMRHPPPEPPPPDRRLSPPPRTSPPTDLAVVQGPEELILPDTPITGGNRFSVSSNADRPVNAFGLRFGGPRKRTIHAGTASPASEAAVEAGLRWLVQHQAADGSWPVETYQDACTASPRCEAGRRLLGPGDDIGQTALAVLCFLGAGYDHRTPNKHRSKVRKAVDWLVSRQTADGGWQNEGAPAGSQAQALAALAFSEAFGLTGDSAMHDPAERGIANLLAQRGPPLRPGEHPSGWDEQRGPGPHLAVTLPTCWSLQALWAARAAELPIADGWESGEQWLDAVWMASAQSALIDAAMLDPARDETGINYAYDPASGRTSAMGADEDIECRLGLGSAGLLIGLLQRRPADDPLIGTLANRVARREFPSTAPMSALSTYQATWSMSLLGGERWQRWNGPVRDLLVRRQRRDAAGCFGGSWDPGPGDALLGNGRPTTTALSILTLEVPYRYAVAPQRDR